MTTTRPTGSALSRRRLLGTAATAAGLVAAAACSPAAPAATASPAPASPPPSPAPSGTRTVPARTLPTPDTVSTEFAPIVGAPLAAGWNDVPSDAAGWRALAAQSAVDPDLPALIAKLGVTVKQDVIAGVPVFRISPPQVTAQRRGQVLMHLHGGGYVLYPGEVGAGEGMIMSGLEGYEVVSVDYRMSPDHPFPAALDDALAVWTALSAQTDPRRMGVFGASAGGGLTLALMLRARDEGVALPAAIAPGTPWVDLTGDGDSRNANDFVDNVLVSDTGWIGAAAPLYAAGHDLRDPLVSPVFGDFRGLPPAILTSGTRDLLLSDTVRAHRKLRQAGVPATLQVFEAMSHAQFLEPGVPETTEAFGEIAAFFDQHLGG